MAPPHRDDACTYAHASSVRTLHNPFDIELYQPSTESAAPCEQRASPHPVLEFLQPLLVYAAGGRAATVPTTCRLRDGVEFANGLGRSACLFGHPHHAPTDGVSVRSVRISHTSLSHLSEALSSSTDSLDSDSRVVLRTCSSNTPAAADTGQR